MSVGGKDIQSLILKAYSKVMKIFFPQRSNENCFCIAEAKRNKSKILIEILHFKSLMFSSRLVKNKKPALFNIHLFITRVVNYHQTVEEDKKHKKR